MGGRKAVTGRGAGSRQTETDSVVRSVPIFRASARNDFDPQRRRSNALAHVYAHNYSV
ncbi:hypothetical protein ACFOGG_06310 [Brenneria rubrifaciens]|uniref:hypothetical protein n=1 Tax=Brenneria rubrifaciens TaxID=55213 RepID=UPI00360CAD3E